MDKIKTSELISKLALASEEACKCEDENFNRIAKENLHNPITAEDLIKIIRATTDFSRFSSIRAISNILLFSFYCLFMQVKKKLLFCD